MRILLAHNFYQAAGGEDRVFSEEAKMLESAGHEVHKYTAHNRDIDAMTKFALARATVWNTESARNIQALIDRHAPHVVHFHNTFPLISPAAYEAAQKAEVPVVQTVHNYRQVCANALLLRRNKSCEKCLNKSIRWPAVLYGCYRNDRIASSVVTLWQALQSWAGRVGGLVNRYVALTHFARNKLIAGGLPGGKIEVKPNFMNRDPGLGSGDGGFALFVGRLTNEKGIDTLIRAWTDSSMQVPLKIAGDGPMAAQVRDLSSNSPHVERLGRQSHSQVLALMKSAACLVLPSLCYEGFPMVLIEASAIGLPVVASRHGAMEEVIQHQETGLLFQPGDARDLGTKVAQVVSDEALRAKLGSAARGRFEAKYTSEINYRKLTKIYSLASGTASAAARDWASHGQAGL